MKTFLGTKLTIIIILLTLLDMGISVALGVIYPQGFYIFGTIGALGFVVIWYISVKVLVPRLTTNKELLSAIEETKNMGPVIKRLPNFYKFRIAQFIALFFIIILGIVALRIESLRLVAWLGLVVVGAAFTRYYISLLKQHPETEQYAIKILSLQKQSESSFVKYVFVGLVFGLLSAALIYFFYFLPKMKELSSYYPIDFSQLQN